MTHVRSLLPILILLVAAIAGCVGGGDDPEPGDPDDPRNPGEERGLSLKPAESNSLEEAFEAIEIVPENDPDWERPNLTKDDWLLLSTTMSEEGSVVAFEWEPPEGAIVKNPRSGGQVIALEIALTLDEMGMADGLTEDIDWMVLLFNDRNDEESGWQTQLSGYEWGAAIEHAQWESTSDPAVTTVPSESGPFILRANAGDLAGDTVYLVLAARGPSGEPFGIGVRALEESEAGRDSASSADWSAFERVVEAEENPPYVPQRVHESQGLFLGWYQEDHHQGERGETIQTVRGGVDVTHQVENVGRPLVPPRASELSSQVDWGGWSSVVIRYTNVPSFVSWSVEGSVNGEDVAKSVQFVSQAAPTCIVTTEGSSGSSITNSVLNPVTADQETLVYQHFSVNVEIESLSGYPLRPNRAC